RAFLYTGSTLFDLNNLISPSVCTNLISADGINDAGQIAATGYDTNGEMHAFLLTPLLSCSAPVVTNQQVELTVSGVPGAQFVVQGSTNLFNWVSVATNTFASNVLVYVDTRATNIARRFYRAQYSQ
ncbi:MAG TPA: hypothetical protein VF988_11305, partial [Verrucomicrobiae bacterium]